MEINKGYFLNLPYTIELTPDEDGYWFASILLLKDCITEGQSHEHAPHILDEAKELWLETIIEEDVDVPLIEPQGVLRE